jgi:uncharacterized protein YbaR (Trm112 family)
VKKELMDILACPLCKGKLKLTVDKKNKQEIVSGSLYCQRCHKHYPIVNSIPHLLSPETT